MKIQHLTPEMQLGHIYRTLDDAGRESMDAHLAVCQDCRAALAEQEQTRSRISREIAAELNGISAPERMTFSRISGHLAESVSWRERLELIAGTAPAALAVAGLVLAVLGAWLDIWDKTSAGSTQPPAFSTLACFLFVLASVQELGRPPTLQPRRVVLSLVAGLLWLGSAFIGLINIIIIRDLSVMFVLAGGGNRGDATAVTMFSIIISVLLYIGVVIGGADYHFKHLEQGGPWKLYIITMLGQLFLLVLPYILTPFIMA